jgi:hypothetical protein
MSWKVEQCVDVGHRDLFRAGADLDDVLAGLHRTLGDNPATEAGSAVGNQQGGHSRLIHPDPDPVARDPRLGDLEDRLADLVTVADAHFVVGQALDGEILTEMTGHQVVAM